MVSSYTPTLSVLITAQVERRDTGIPTDAQTVVVAILEASSLPSLPNARVETGLIQEIVSPDGLTVPSDDHGSVAAVLAKLPHASVLHLACQGQQSQGNPLTGGFSLYDGRLTVKQLMQLQLLKAELAYLSACNTASTDKYQPDEAINLAATMLFVGFKSVIATM